MKESAKRTFTGQDAARDALAANSRPLAVPALLAAVATGVAACYNPADPAQVQPFVISLLAFIFGSIALTFLVILLVVRYFLRKLGAITTPIANGVPADAIIETIADTGFTASAPGLGANSPRYRLGLQVIPADQFQLALQSRDHNLHPAYLHSANRARAKIGVVVDATNPSNVMLDLVRLGRVPTRTADDPDARTRVCLVRTIAASSPAVCAARVPRSLG